MCISLIDLWQLLKSNRRKNQEYIVKFYQQLDKQEIQIKYINIDQVNIDKSLSKQLYKHLMNTKKAHKESKEQLSIPEKNRLQLPVIRSQTQLASQGEYQNQNHNNKIHREQSESKPKMLEKKISNKMPLWKQTCHITRRISQTIPNKLSNIEQKQSAEQAESKQASTTRLGHTLNPHPSVLSLKNIFNNDQLPQTAFQSQFPPTPIRHRQPKKKTASISNFLKHMQSNVQDSRDRQFYHDLTSRIDTQSQIMSILDIKYSEHCTSFSNPKSSKPNLIDKKFQLFLLLSTLKQSHSALKQQVMSQTKNYEQSVQLFLSETKKLLDLNQQEIAAKAIRIKTLELELKDIELRADRDAVRVKGEMGVLGDRVGYLEGCMRELEGKYRQEQQQNKQIKKYNKQLNQLLLNSYKKIQQLQSKLTSQRKTYQETLNKQVQKVSQKFEQLFRQQQSGYELRLENNKIKYLNMLKMNKGLSFIDGDKLGQETEAGNCQSLSHCDTGRGFDQMSVRLGNSASGGFIRNSQSNKKLISFKDQKISQNRSSKNSIVSPMANNRNQGSKFSNNMQQDPNTNPQPKKTNTIKTKSSQPILQQNMNLRLNKNQDKKANINQANSRSSAQVLKQYSVEIVPVVRAGYGYNDDDRNLYPESEDFGSLEEDQGNQNADQVQVQQPQYHQCRKSQIGGRKLTLNKQQSAQSVTFYQNNKQSLRNSIRTLKMTPCPCPYSQSSHTTYQPVSPVTQQPHSQSQSHNRNQSIYIALSPPPPFNPSIQSPNSVGQTNSPKYSSRRFARTNKFGNAKGLRESTLDFRDPSGGNIEDVDVGRSVDNRDRSLEIQSEVRRQPKFSDIKVIANKANECNNTKKKQINKIDQQITQQIQNILQIKPDSQSNAYSQMTKQTNNTITTKANANPNYSMTKNNGNLNKANRNNSKNTNLNDYGNTSVINNNVSNGNTNINKSRNIVQIDKKLRQTVK